MIIFYNYSLLYIYYRIYKRVFNNSWVDICWGPSIPLVFEIILYSFLVSSTILYYTKTKRKKHFLYLQENFFYICEKILFYICEKVFLYLRENFFYICEKNVFIFPRIFFYICEKNFLYFRENLFYIWENVFLHLWENFFIFARKIFLYGYEIFYNNLGMHTLIIYFSLSLLI